MWVAQNLRANQVAPGCTEFGAHWQTDGGIGVGMHARCRAPHTGTCSCSLLSETTHSCLPPLASPACRNTATSPSKYGIISSIFCTTILRVILDLVWTVGIIVKQGENQIMRLFCCDCQEYPVKSISYSCYTHCYVSIVIQMLICFMFL